MHYRIFNGPIKKYTAGMTPPSLNYTGDIVVAIDPSKSNMAVVVGDPGGEIISIVEMSGNLWKTPKAAMDTTDYCIDAKDFLRQYLAGANLYRVGMEKAITKKGMEHHLTNMVLTEVRSMLLNLFKTEYGLRDVDVEVNNWSWKHAILPDGYRSQSEKGSVRYFLEYLNDTTYINYFEDDVTDAVCIYKYLTMETKKTYAIVCREDEPTTKDIRIQISPNHVDVLGNRQFRYNPTFNPAQNAKYFANRSTRNGICKVDLKALSMSDIYTYASGFTTIPNDDIRLVVRV